MPRAASDVTVRRPPTEPGAGAPSAGWHALPLEEVSERLGVHATGLSTQEARARLAAVGPNELPHRRPPSWWEIALHQFKSPLIYVLAAAAGVSIAIGEATDAAFIAAVLVINAIIGTLQEWRAEKSSQALQRLLKIRATVERDDELREIDAQELVPGDLVWLESGNRVPADIRLSSAQGLEVDESLLTGESQPVGKDPAWSGDPETPVSDRLNMVHAGSIVTRGRARGTVVATGASTLIGQLAEDVLNRAAGKPPLLQRMERFARVVAVAVLVAAVLIGLAGYAAGRYDLSQMFLFVVALAVSAIPEGLPVAMTVALSIATTRMARRGVIVRRLTAVEGLGSCTLIATDKTGTLTCNELTIREIQLPDGRMLEVTGQGFVPAGRVLEKGEPLRPSADLALLGLARCGVLCNEADLHRKDDTWSWRGDAVDVAFLSLGEKAGVSRATLLDRHALVATRPFEPEHRYAAAYHLVDGAPHAFVKGAPERVLAMCDLSPDEEAAWTARAEAMAARGCRVLALASGAHEGVPTEASTPGTLCLLGLVGMIDPLRPGAREAVAKCREAGIRVVMVTGDHRVTALAISRDLGLATSEREVVTGAELAGTPPEAWPELIDRVRVFARVAPEQKLQIVEAAKAAGHFVAVTGDGVNDAPALRAANIGVAMGKSGTDVARETAELVISDDNFATIVAGVEEGRIAYDNVRKVIYLLVSTGAAELVLVGLSVLAGLPLPLVPVQLLWLNLVTNGIQHVALAFEPGEGDVLRRRPRPPGERIFNRLMIERTVLGAVVMGVLAFLVFRWLLASGWTEELARNSLLLLMVLFENFHIGNCRSETTSVLRQSPLRSPMLVGAALLALLVHTTMMYLPFGKDLLGAHPIAVEHWLVLVGVAALIVPAMEAHKLLWRRRQARS
jgi:Ca2+-transporting ATPase